MEFTQVDRSTEQRADPPLACTNPSEHRGVELERRRPGTRTLSATTWAV